MVHELCDHHDVRKALEARFAAEKALVDHGHDVLKFPAGFTQRAEARQRRRERRRRADHRRHAQEPAHKVLEEDRGEDAGLVKVLLRRQAVQLEALLKP